jgi:uncharacterized membrane protein
MVVSTALASSQTNTFMTTSQIQSEPTKPLPRWLILAIVVGVLFIMAFYAVTDSNYLAHDHVLEGADWLGYAICHRITERSFAINGRQFPLCARCTGMYLGAALTMLVLWLAGRARYTALPPLPILLTLLGFIAIMGADGLNSYSHFFANGPHLYEPRNWLRLLTGMGTGLALGAIILPALSQTLWCQQEFRPSVNSFRELVGLVLVGGTAVLLILSNQTIVLYVLALISTVGLLIVVTVLNSVMVLILSRRESLAVTWQQATLPLLIGVTLAVAELSAISLLRFNLTGTMTGFPGL